MKRIAIEPNTSKKGWQGYTLEVAKILHEFGAEVLIDAQLGKEIGPSDLVHYVHKNELCVSAELIITLGGDGTLMRAAKFAAINHIPVLGINIGHLGYMVELELHECRKYLERIVADDFACQERMMLCVELIRDGECIMSTIALNDVFMAKYTMGRMLDVEVFIDGMPITTYKGDGVIVSSPSGSTAYALSAGGPVLEPRSENILITPICPHTLVSRPMVLAGDRVVTMRAKEEYKDALVVCDGEAFCQMHCGDEIRVKRANNLLKLICVKDRSFYDILREKLSERGNNP
jgi:NAD+ kinase